MTVLAQADIGVYVEAAVEFRNMSVKEQEEVAEAAEAKNGAFEQLAATIPANAMRYFRECVEDAPKDVQEALAGVSLLEKPKTPEQKRAAAAAEHDMTGFSSDSESSSDSTSIIIKNIVRGKCTLIPRELVACTALTQSSSQSSHFSQPVSIITKHEASLRRH